MYADDMEYNIGSSKEVNFINLKHLNLSGNHIQEWKLTITNKNSHR